MPSPHSPSSFASQVNCLMHFIEAKKLPRPVVMPVIAAKPSTPHELVLRSMADGRGYTRSDLLRMSGITVGQLNYVLSCLVTHKKVIRDGDYDNRRYYLNQI